VRTLLSATGWHPSTLPRGDPDAFYWSWWFLRPGNRPYRIDVGGDSRRRRLTLALIATCADVGEDLRVAAWLLSPWQPHHVGARHPHQGPDIRSFTRTIWRICPGLLPPRTNRKDPRISPLYADWRSRPSMIQWGSAETLWRRDELAAGAGAATVPHHSWRSRPAHSHAWPLWHRISIFGRPPLGYPRLQPSPRVRRSG